MTTRAWILLSFFFLTGCHEQGASSVPTAPTPPPTVPSVASCAPTVVSAWSTSPRASGPQVAVSSTPLFGGYEVSIGDWSRIVTPGREIDLPRFGWYTVRGVNACGAWTAPHPFYVAANPNASGELSAPPVPPVEPEPELGDDPYCVRRSPVSGFCEERREPAGK